MSSARSNASARNRRAQSEIKPSYPPHQQQMNNGQHIQQQQQQQQQQQAKLSISDAIGLITLRLGRVENLVQNNPNAGSAESSNSEDMQAIKHILGRLADLEQRVENTITSPSNTNSNPDIEHFNSQMAAYKENQEKILFEVNNLKEKYNKKLTDVDNKVPSNNTKFNDQMQTFINLQEKLNTDVNNLKDEYSKISQILMSLQSFTMETNKKLTDMVFHSEEEAIFKNNFESNENIIDEPHIPREINATNTQDSTSFTRLIITNDEDLNEQMSDNTTSSAPSIEIQNEPPVTNIFTGLQKTKITHLETSDIDARLPDTSPVNKLDDNIVDSVSQSLDTNSNSSSTRTRSTKNKKKDKFYNKP